MSKIKFTNSLSSSKRALKAKVKHPTFFRCVKNTIKKEYTTFQNKTHYTNSKRYKDNLYPKGYQPVLPQTLKIQRLLDTKQDVEKPNSGIDIINNLVVDENSLISKKCMIEIYNTKLDEYIEKINNFNIDDEKKLLLMYLLAQNNTVAEATRIEPQTDKLMELFVYCLEDIEKTDFSEEKNKYKLQKLLTLSINNFDNDKCRSIIFDDKYDLLPMAVINHIGTFYNANQEIDNFLSLGNVIDDLKKDDFFSKQIDNINGEVLYGFVHLINNTKENSDYKDLSKKDLIFCKTFLSLINTNYDDGGSLTILNNMLNKLRPKLAVNNTEETTFLEEIDEKLSIISKLYLQTFPQITDKQKVSLNNILSIEDELKKVDIDSITRTMIEENETLSYIFNAVPGLMNTIGRTQAGHTYTLDKHIISVAQNVVKDEEYQKLDDNNKKILLIAALMHDVTKKEGGSDPLHPQTSAEFAYYTLKNVLDKKDRLTLSNLIYNHHFNALVGNESFINNVAYECAYDKNDKFIQMLSILGKADLYGNPLIKDKYLPTLEPNIEKLNARIKLIKQTLSKMKEHIALTAFPQDANIKHQVGKEMQEELKKMEILSHYTDSETGEEIPVIDLTKMTEIQDIDKQKQYFEALGFGNDTTYDNLNLLVHAIDAPAHVKGLEGLFDTYKTDAILSTSNITMKNPVVFKQRYCGVIFDRDNTNVLDFSGSDLYSGGKKKRSEIGKFVNHSLNNSDPVSSEALNKWGKKDTHSEILVTDFSISAIFVRKDRYSQDNVYSDSLLKPLFDFAQKHKLSVILIPKMNK